jgi:hypothetical protein
MKKELLIASALTASLGMVNVAEAGANVSYSGSVTRGVTQDSLVVVVLIHILQLLLVN